MIFISRELFSNGFYVNGRGKVRDGRVQSVTEFINDIKQGCRKTPGNIPPSLLLFGLVVGMYHNCGNIS